MSDLVRLALAMALLATGCTRGELVHEKTEVAQFLLTREGQVSRTVELSGMFEGLGVVVRLPAGPADNCATWPNSIAYQLTPRAAKHQSVRCPAARLRIWPEEGRDLGLGVVWHHGQELDAGRGVAYVECSSVAAEEVMLDGAPAEFDLELSWSFGNEPAAEACDSEATLYLYEFKEVGLARRLMEHLPRYVGP